MSEKLTLVVTCTDRKSLPVPEQRMLRSTPHGDLKLAAWTHRIESAETLSPLRALYQGEAWTQLPRIEEAARTAGFEPTTYVASAGLGLRLVSTSGPAYAATFAPNHADSVPGTITQQRAWWDQLNEWNGSHGTLPPRRQALFVLSRRYADVLAPLVTKTAVTNAVLVVGGSDAIASSRRLPSDANLRPALGGTRGALNMRMAVAWLERLSASRIDSEPDRVSWGDWASEVGRQERYDRTPLRDSAVRERIELMRAHDPAISKTRALRSLRASGFACEQHRFAQLFDNTRGGAS